MNTLTLTIALMGIIGLIGAVVLLVGSKAFAVEEDERLAEVTAMLPGANCGSCGYAGCAAYAQAMIEGAPVNSCGPGGSETAKRISEYLGVDAGEVAEKRAIVACRGTSDRVVLQERAAYDGMHSCRIYATMGHLSDGCTDGCIGFGDCMDTCPYGAISLNKNEVAVVDPAVCIGCGLCTTICPRHLISLVEKTDRSEVSFVLCHNTLMGKRAKDACANTCLGCRRCVKVCPQQCITVEDNVAHIDISRCIDCKACIGVCPEGAIYPLTWIPKQ